jgi:hypothetical protein
MRVIFLIATSVASLYSAQPDQPQITDVKAFEGIVAFSQSLSGWALLIAGGSIVILVGTSYGCGLEPSARYSMDKGVHYIKKDSHDSGFRGIPP